MFLNEIVEFETTFEKAVSVSLGVCIAASRSYWVLISGKVITWDGNVQDKLKHIQYGVTCHVFHSIDW